jgi:hypothetical protein
MRGRKGRERRGGGAKDEGGDTEEAERQKAKATNQSLSKRRARVSTTTKVP